MGAGERVEGASNQIEYPDEDPWVREKFEGELAKRGLQSIMPEEAYKSRQNGTTPARNSGTCYDLTPQDDKLGTAKVGP